MLLPLSQCVTVGLAIAAVVVNSLDKDKKDPFDLDF